MFWLKLLQTYGPVDLARAVGAEALGKHDSPRARKRLMTLLRDRSPLVVMAATESLRKHLRNGSLLESERSMMVDAMLTYVRDRHPELAGFAIRMLGELEAKQAIPALLQVLEESTIAERQNLVDFAIVSLGALKASEAIPRLYQLAFDGSDASRQLRAADAIQQIGVQFLDSPSKQAFVAIVCDNWQEVERQGSHAIEPMNHVLKNILSVPSLPSSCGKLQRVVDFLGRRPNALSTVLLAETYLKVTEDRGFYYTHSGDTYDSRTNSWPYQGLPRVACNAVVAAMSQFHDCMPDDLLRRLTKLQNFNIHRTPNRGDLDYDDPEPSTVCAIDNSPIVELAKAELARRGQCE